jgi:hypothetical protein
MEVRYEGEKEGQKTKGGARRLPLRGLTSLLKLKDEFHAELTLGSSLPEIWFAVTGVECIDSRL